MAGSSEDFEKEWNAYVQALKEAGVEEVMAKYNELYHTRMEAWRSAE